MNIKEAVFNNHVNNAHEKAITFLKEHVPAYAEEIDGHNKDGIMSIFNKEPTLATSAYAMLVTYFVNDK